MLLSARDITAQGTTAAQPTTGPPRNKTPIYIAGFFPFEDYFNSVMVNSTQIAIDHVNEFEGLLADYELKMIWAWAQSIGDSGNPSIAPSLHATYDFIYNQPQFLMTWGPVYSRTGQTLNQVVQRYNLVQVCIAQFVSDEHHVEKYPLTVQIYPSSGVFNPARIVLMQQMQWQKAAIIFENFDLFRLEMEELVGLFSANNLSIITLEAITGDNPRANVDNLEKHDARIIFATFYQEMAVKVFCEAYRRGMYGDKYVWILLGWYSPARWWEQEVRKLKEKNADTCEVEQIEKVVEGSLSIRGFEIQQNMSQINFNGVHPKKNHLEFYKYLQDQLLTAGACDSYAYDQIITIALALNASIEPLAKMDPPKRLEDFSYDNAQMAGVFREKAASVDFVGLTGRVAFDRFAARESKAVVQQIQGGNITQIFVYDSSQKTVANITSFIWGGGFVPVDGPTVTYTPLKISQLIKIVVYVLSGVGVAVSVIFLCLNMRFKNSSAIKISSPQLNNMIALGSMLLYGSTFLYALKIEVNEDITRYTVYCQLSSGILCVGLSLAFGALFMKTFRVHHIYTSAMKLRKSRATITDSKLMSAIGLFVVVDAIIFGLWMYLDPVVLVQDELQRRTINKAKEIYDSQIFYYCTSKDEIYYSIAIFVYKGALLIFGIFLAWSTRNVRIAQLNDSKYIALSVYAVGLTCVLTVPVAFFSHGQGDIDFVYAFVCGALLFANTIMLCLVFIPKFISLRNNTDGGRLNTFMPSNTFTVSQDRQAAISRCKERLQEKTARLERLVEQLRELKKAAPVQ
ncbi:gamma-aminobutyric acid type B receptor subunit 2-like [Asterias rubens]|uniref:gamma-aminobutyric acid type B receptor subunit 2-like n=1 Tax=Asterias rubens TaxID=7604 RepID=UPI00145570F1|nr:gamma-aminobutyric acid type B receptor subunit 2-like [Asterias rubens]